MGKQIKAIETRYAGCRFRSRIEARWAVFFDALGIKWEYEKQGFVFDGTPYLPDFWLPDQRCWVEVKGAHHNPDRPVFGMDTPEDWKLCQSLATESGHPVFMLFGELCPLLAVSVNTQNGDGGTVVIHGSNRGWYPDPKMYDDGCCEWAECTACGMLGIGLHGHHDLCGCCCPGRLVTQVTPWGYSRLACNLCGSGKEGQHIGRRSDSPRLMAAYRAARSARFDGRR